MSSLRRLLDSRPGALVMGILNVTPDSFSDGGRYLVPESALERAHVLVSEGADIVDVGAESTRPGAEPVSAALQIERIGSVIRHVASLGALVSIDTISPEVATWALEEGASIVNSISPEPAAELGAIAARRGAALVLMHSRGSMQSMKGYSVYDDEAYTDVTEEVAASLREAADRARNAGLDKRDILLDPGLGFSKNARHSLELCGSVQCLLDLGYDVLVGASRKSFLAKASAGAGVVAVPPSERLGGSIAAALACVARGARVVRVHDVAPTVQALSVAAAIEAATAQRLLRAQTPRGSSLDA